METSIANKTTIDDKSKRRLKAPSTTQAIVGALLVGIGFGLFFGDIVSPLKIIGDAYVGLLQMTVLPYIVTSIISSIGSLTPQQARLLASYGILFLVLLWGIGAGTVVGMSMAFPELETGAFFSTTLIEAPRQINHVDLYIPSNPFESLANNYVPAVVLFCVLFGVAIMTLEDRGRIIALFEVATATLRRVNGFVIKLSPIGIFAISASAAGTLSLEEFGRLQGYLLTFGASAVFLTFLVLPMLVTVFTPFRYLEVLSASKDALITAFVTGSTFVVIPLLCSAIAQLFEKHKRSGEQQSIRHEFVIPLAYAFPDTGKVLSLIFIPFAAWFYGDPLGLSDYPFILLTGIFLVFGKLILAIPFLLEAQQLPSDIFQLFLISGVVAGRISDLVTSMHLVVLTVLSTSVLAGLMRFRPSRLVPAIAGCVLVGVILVVSIHSFLGATFADSFKKEAYLAEMQNMRSTVDVRMIEPASPNPFPLLTGQSRLERIQDRSVIRIGYQPDRLPFSYFNAAGTLVGFDVDLVHRLARDLDVKIEFVPYEIATLNDQLKQDHFDIAISGVHATVESVTKMLMTDPYLHAHFAIIVPDYRKRDFETVESVRRLGPVTLALLEYSESKERVKNVFPEASVVELARERDFFLEANPNVDGLITTAEGGSAWTLVYPDYHVVSPLKPAPAAPLVIPLGGREDLIFEEFLTNWVELIRLEGVIDELYNHWVLGKTAQNQEPRWSIIRDILGWVD